VYFTGSELSALPVTPSEGPSQGVWMSAEAYRVVARSLRRYSLSFLYTFGVFWQCTPQTMTQPIKHHRALRETTRGEESNDHGSCRSSNAIDACAQIEMSDLTPFMTHFS
jgi:hypothetical protein